MRHDGRAENSYGNVKHAGITDNRGRGHEKATKDPPQAGTAKENFKTKADANRADQHNYQRFQKAKAFLLQKKNHEYIQRGEAYSHQQGDVEQEIKRDCRTDDFRQIAGRDRDFRDRPLKEGNRSAEVIAASLRQIAPRDNSQLDGQ